ncbi:hypothetical protein DOY81_007488 [Sarcophaga bullata]|nr:hypothetical protein DOY81_007488 [Sarcophaga bullata]
MDMLCWKKVLLQWISECGFMERNYLNIEQSDLEAFYHKFSLQHQKTATEKFKHVGDFLKEFYPQFELNFDDENCLSSADYIYFYSLLLHFCCVKHPETVFHEICQRLPENSQQCIASFFKQLLEAEPLTKEAVRHAIAEVANNQVTPPRSNDSFASSTASVSVGGLSTASSFSRCESPLKTPKRSAGPQRVSPSTPKTFLLEERTRELFNLRAQLETERYEKGLLELQIKQNEDKIQKLNNDHKKLLQQIQDLKNDILVNSTATGDGSTNRSGKENQVQKRLLKELSQREQEIAKLSDNIRTLNEERSLEEKKRCYAEGQTIICMSRIKELECKLDDLKEDLESQNEHIQALSERKLELEQFIAETRSSNVNRDLNESADGMDGSFTRNANTTASSSSINSPENLGVSVIDVQLREKEHENQQLKEELRNVKREHKRLAKHLTKLTDEFDLPLDAVSTSGSENSEQETGAGVVEEVPVDESTPDEEISCSEHFHIFNSCMEKIYKFHKTEKLKIKQLEKETKKLGEENQQLTMKVEQFQHDITELKGELVTKQKTHERLENAKEKIEANLEKTKFDLQNIKKQKENLVQQIESLEHDKRTLNENIKELKAKLETKQSEYTKLSAKFTKNETTLQNQLKEIQKELLDKSVQWEEELKRFSDKIVEQSEEIATHKQTEMTLKCNYDEMVVQNEKLKKEARQANNHLNDMQKLLKDKEKQMHSLGAEISELKDKNKDLEKNINDLMTENHNFKLNKVGQMEMDEQLKKLKDQLSKTTLLMESKQHECDLKHQQIKDLEAKVADVQKLFGDSPAKDNVLQNVAEIEIKIKNLININHELKNKIQQLKDSHTEMNSLIQEHNQELQERSKTIADCEEKLSKLQKEKDEFEKKNKALNDANKKHSTAQEDLVKVKKRNEDLESKYNKLKKEHDTSIKKFDKDLQELQEHLKKAKSEYEASLDRITQELKSERQQLNDKEMELIIIKAERTEINKKLKEAEQESLKHQTDKDHLQQSLNKFETRISQFTTENDKLRQEIETFKKEVSHNAIRLLEADKALIDFMELTKQQDAVKDEVDFLQSALNERDQLLNEMQLKLEQQTQYEKELKRQLEEKSEMVISTEELLEKLGKDKERLAKDAETKNQQILKEQQDKLMLLNSLEKSADQLKLSTEQKEQQIEALEHKLHELKENFDSLTLQNTKLQGDLIEREAELRLSLDEQQQEKEDFQQKFSQLMQKLSNKSEELKTIDLELMEIVAIVENNFNLSQEMLNESQADNIFKYNEMDNEKNIQKLRQQLNIIFFTQQQLKVQIIEICNEKEEAVNAVVSLEKTNNELLAKCNQQERELTDIREQLQNEEYILEKRITQEVKRLEDDLLNLEKVNERLANENVNIQTKLGNAEQELNDANQKLQSAEEECLQIKEQLRSKSSMLDKLQQEEKKLQHALKEKQQQYEKNLEKSKNLETQLKEKTSKLQILDKEYQEFKEKTNKNQQKINYYQQSQQNQQTEIRKLQEKLKLLQNSNDNMELEMGNKNKEILTIKNENIELLQKYKDMEEQLLFSTKKLDEIVSIKLNAETKCEQLQSEAEQLKRDLEFIKGQQKTQQDDYNRLLQDIELLKQDKQQLKDEINQNKTTIQRSNDNISQLIQQISSIRLEKEAALDETQLLRQQLEETGKLHTTSETKMKSIIEKSQEFERKLLTAENELKSLKADLEKSESTAKKLQTENKKLRDNQEMSTKRIEKIALKLGDTQARSSKLEKDNEKLCRALEAHTANVEALQKEKDLLQSEAKSLKERLSRAERGHEQLTAKTQNLEYQLSSLQQIKQKLESCEIDYKTKINKLEKLRDTNEEKLRKLSNALNNAENANVKLNLEVGSLNSQLQEVKNEHKKELQHQLEDLKRELEEIRQLANKYEEINEKLKIEVQNLTEEKSSLNDQLSKTSLSLQINMQKCEKFTMELEQIRAEMLIIRQEKSQIELQHETSMQKLTEFESENTKLLSERKNLIISLEERIAHLEDELTAKTKEVVDLQKEIQVLKENSKEHASKIQEHTTNNLTQLEDLRIKLSQAEEIRRKEEEIISQLRLDNKILHTKYQESKQRALDAERSSDERIKENRLELEGKLEKMKNKMKTLYTEEITKMKSKQEREMAVVKSEMEVLKAQNTKYEEHTRKLSNQIVRLNDNILQHQKENTILSTKLKHVMEQLQDSERNKRPNSIHVSTISSTSAGSLVGAPTNLEMEDEEGEELKYRNSLLPPHLRSTYAAQFDHEFSEDDLKEGPHSLDDSMSALLSTTAGGTRKKCSGVTHYKRPGPPTPSKNGGRLSFGGISEPPREILKESYDTNAAVSSTKTPARFNFFASRFSMGGPSKDEKPFAIKTDSSKLRQSIQKPKVKGSHGKLLSKVLCTSTPRKSKVHYDQRRLLDQLMKSSPSPSPLAIDNKAIKIEKQSTSPVANNMIETPLTALDKPASATQTTITKRLVAIASGLRRSRRNSSMFGRRLSRRLQEICTPTSGETSSPTPVVNSKPKKQLVVVSSVGTSGSVSKTALLQKRLRKRPKREKKTRPSLCLTGNIFAANRTSNNKDVLHDLNRCKSRKQRFEHFNYGRDMQSPQSESQEEEPDETLSTTKTLSNITFELQNTNYVTFNHNKMLEEAVVIAKCGLKSEENPQDTFTFGEELFEGPHIADVINCVNDYESNGVCNDDVLHENEKDCNCNNSFDKDAHVKKLWCQHELVTSQDLENFDRFVANIQQINSKGEEEDFDEYSSRGSSQHFEKLLGETESVAPFTVDLNKFNESKNSSSSSRSSNTNSLSSLSQRSEHRSVSIATPHHSPNNRPCQLSRTIYGSTVIYNHRLPEINATYVRKSSIYVKSRHRSSGRHHSRASSSSNDVILITNQTITFVDILRMWSQMDNSTRLIVCFAILASCTTLLGLFVSFSSRR